MQFKVLNIISAAVTSSLSASYATAALGYIQLAPFSALTTTGSTNYLTTTIDGTTAYNAIGDTNLKEITRTTGLGGTVSTTQIDSSADINTATGGTNSFSGMLRSNNATTLQYADTQFDSVFRINKASGAISTYVNKATLQGTAAAFNVFGSSIYSTGEAVIYDNTSATARFRATSAGSAVDVVSFGALTTAVGGTYAFGGFTAGPGDNLILADSTSTNRRIVQYDPSTGTGTTLLTPAQISAVTGAAAPQFSSTAFYYQSVDGLVYFYDNTSKNILSFDPAAPVATLTNVLTGSQLVAGPEGANAVTYFSTFNNQIAWANITPVGRGLYAVPEPASLAIVGVGAITLLRRRRA